MNSMQQITLQTTKERSCYESKPNNDSQVNQTLEVDSYLKLVDYIHIRSNVCLNESEGANR